MTRGIVLFAIGGDKVDYLGLGIMACAFAKKNMPGVPVSLITNTDTVAQYYSVERKEWLDNSSELFKWFDKIIFIEDKSSFDNIRIYRDTHYHSVNQQFKNESRSSVYDLSPYDETLLIDSDYLICNSTLNGVWGSTEDVMINSTAISMRHAPLQEEETRLSPFGIKMYWATVIYFKKSEKAKLLFDLVQHIKQNWDFYKLIYEFPGNLFRNDYAFSIAIHILNGYNYGDFVTDLPEPQILSALDTDQFYGITSPTVLHFFINDSAENWKFYASKTVGLNVHCMNKLSLINNMDKIMEVLSE